MTSKQNLLTPLVDFLKIESVSTQDKYLPEMQKARQYLVGLFRSLGFNTKILKGKKHDAVFAEKITNKSLPTVLVYGHYDVQPPEPISEWKTKPFKPTVKNDRIIARGAADNKGQHMIHIMAVKKLKEKGKLPVNFKFIIEGEEEIGSISIEAIAKKYSKSLLKSDYLMVSDTGMRKGEPVIDTGLRGLVYVEVDITTGKRDLHSGGYGGVAENPAILLSKVISKLKDENGRVLIPSFYDDVEKLSKKELEKIKNIVKNKQQIINEGNLYGIGGGEIKYSLGERKWTRPTLDVNGIWSGYTQEGSKTIIPATASAKISMRLVPNQDNDKVYSQFEKYVKTLVPSFAKLKVTRHADCLVFKAPTDNPVFDLMKQSQKKVYGKEPIYKRVSGSIGFVPIMVKALNVPCLMVGFALPGAKIHSPNEWFSLTNYYKGVDVMESFYSKLPILK